MKKIAIIFIITFFFVSKGFSQELSPVILNTTGGSGNDNNIYFEWSVGEETAIETMSSSQNFITHGILQPINRIPNLNKCWGPEEIKISPNPTNSWINIKFYSVQTGKISMILVDASGRRISITQFDYYGFDHVERMDLSRYGSGVYFLNILLDPTGKSVRKECAAFKIVKLNL